MVGVKNIYQIWYYYKPTLYMCFNSEFGRPSWDVFSMLGYNRSRSNSGAGTDFPFMGRTTQSEKFAGAAPSPDLPVRAEVTPGGSHARRYSAGDMELDFALFDEAESPDGNTLPRTRSRTCSNPSRVSSSLLSSSKDAPASTGGRGGLPMLQFYNDNDDDDDGAYGDEENQLLEGDVDGESYEDDDSLSYEERR